MGDPVAFRPTGCQGIELDDPTSTWQNGSQSNSAWLSPRADCPKQDLLNEWGKPVYQIVEEFADDHDVWAKQFLSAWERMQRIGYAGSDLSVGPRNSWMGYYPLKEMGAPSFKNKWSFANYIKDNAPLVFTKESINPWICGNHADRCGTRASEIYQVAGVPMEAANGQSCDNVEQCNDPTFG